MLSVPRLMTILMLAGGTLLLNGKATPAETRVDLALVLAVDVSFSMEPDEQELQRHGFVEAFQSSEVHQAIRRGVLGRIAVVYVEWSGAFDQADHRPLDRHRAASRWPGLCGAAFAESTPQHERHVHFRGHRLRRPATPSERPASGSAGHRRLG